MTGCFSSVLINTLPVSQSHRASRISEIIAGQRAISADTDLRLCHYLGLSPGYWLRAQAAHDTEVASAAMGVVLAGIQPLVRG